MEQYLQYLKLIVEFLAIFGVVIEITPIKVSPLAWIGKRLNKETISKMDKLEKRIEDLEDKSLKRDLKEDRSVILDFANSMRNGRRHTAEEFDHIIDMIYKYHEICEKHNISNGVIDTQSHFIIETYKELLHKAVNEGNAEQIFKQGNLL